MINRFKGVAATVALLFPLLLSAQDYIRCSTNEYREALLRAYPETEARAAEIYARANQWLSQNAHSTESGAVTIPVVVHIVYNTAEQNLHDSIILSQLDVLNEDYARLNPDTGQTPFTFRPYGANTQLQFCLAKRTPDNQPATGIERRLTTVTEWNDYSMVKSAAAGGLDAWDANRYLNIWICNMSGSTLGYSTMPGDPMNVDGVVIDYQVFGRKGNVLLPKYNRGRTTTHEVGHWLGLRHIWGDGGGSCTGDDFIADTPVQDVPTYGCPSYPKTDKCSAALPGIMFMNYMDYTDDGCMNIFTKDQSVKMQSILNTFRSTIIASLSCMDVGIPERDYSRFITAYPNPSNGSLYIRFTLRERERITLRLTDITGRVCLEQNLYPAYDEVISLPVSALSQGFYALHISAEHGASTQRIHLVK